MRTIPFSWLLLVVPALVGASEIESAAKAMGGAENLRVVLAAEMVSFEKVTVLPITRITGFDGTHVKTEELTVIDWRWGMRLSVDAGPIAVPTSVAARLRKVLMSDDVIPDWKLGCQYYPTYRFVLKEDGHTLEIFVLETTGGFETYRDGVRIGSHSGDDRIIRDLKDLLRNKKEMPSKLPEPTPDGVARR